jgi:uncharacterized protein YbbK (DUF523 family)
MIIASACLLGLNCRWDGRSSKEEKLFLFLPEIIPVCPEQLGGLATPRNPAQIIDGNGNDVLDGKAKVINDAGYDVTKEFIQGAQEILKISQLYKVTKSVLKERSPSCGVHHIYHGQSLADGMGVTCAFLRRAGVQVLSSEEIDNAKLLSKQI